LGPTSASFFYLGDSDGSLLKECSIVKIGTAVGALEDIRSDAIFNLSPPELDLTLTKIEGKPQSDIIIMDSGRVQNIRWIRIKLSDSDRENEILNLDFRN
jgi:hypothetical protein